MSAVDRPWTHDELRAKAAWLIQGLPEDFTNRFGVVVHGDDLHRLGPEPGEDYLPFVDRILDMCAKQHADAVIVAWQWPEVPYVSTMLACPLEGSTTVAVFPKPLELN